MSVVIPDSRILTKPGLFAAIFGVIFRLEQNNIFCTLRLLLPVRVRQLDSICKLSGRGLPFERGVHARRKFLY